MAKNGLKMNSETLFLDKPFLKSGISSRFRACWRRFPQKSGVVKGREARKKIFSLQGKNSEAVFFLALDNPDRCGKIRHARCGDFRGFKPGHRPGIAGGMAFGGRNRPKGRAL